MSNQKGRFVATEEGSLTDTKQTIKALVEWEGGTSKGQQVLQWIRPESGDARGKARARGRALALRLRVRQLDGVLGG